MSRPVAAVREAGHHVGMSETTIDRTLERTVTPSTTDGDDSERFAHYVEKDKVVESAVTGMPLRALCGKIWTPSRDPSKFPVCPECAEIYASLPKGE